MRVTLALLADYANVTREGKLNIMGVFDRINVVTMPTQHREMQMVLRLEAQYVERGRPHSMEIKLQDPDGQEVFSMTGEISVGGGAPGEIIASNHIIKIGNLPIRHLGTHMFAIWLDGDLKTQIPLAVQQITPGQPRLPGT